MPISEFLATVAQEGRAIVPPPGALSHDDWQMAARTLSELDEHYRLEMPHQPPALDMPAALWAASTFYRACQAAAYRDLDAATVQQQLSEPCPVADSPAVHYSVDLTFRFLPSLLKFATTASEDDVLNACLRDLARRWPLSSVGIAELGEIDVNTIVAWPSLLTLYVDRIIATEDITRLADERVADAVRAAIGLHDELTPALTEALQAE